MQLERGYQSENQLADRGLWALSDQRMSNLAKKKKHYYSPEMNLGQYSSPSLSPLISHTQQNITLSKIKCERFIFL